MRPAAALLLVLAAALPAAAGVRDPAPVPTSNAALVENLGSMETLATSAKWDSRRGAYFAPASNGREVELTLDRELQKQMEALLDLYKVPAGAVVALDPRDGRVLAMAEHAEEDWYPKGLGLKPIYPAASVFKIITGTALLEAGVPLDEEVCFHGGKHSLDLRELKDDPKRDSRCATLSHAMGSSLNVVIGKLANRLLQPPGLRAVAERFFFNTPLPHFPPPPDITDSIVSPAVIPDDELGFSRAAAGFGRVYMAPLHGAFIAGAIGNGGLAVDPQIVVDVTRRGERGVPPPPGEHRIVSEAVARSMNLMLQRTVRDGTAQTAFRAPRRSVLKQVTIAGKTGSLADKKPFRDYTWFVGFAPAEAPTIAVAAVIVNGYFWRVRASYVAREAFRVFLETERSQRRRAER